MKDAVAVLPTVRSTPTQTVTVTVFDEASSAVPLFAVAVLSYGVHVPATPEKVFEYLYSAERSVEPRRLSLSYTSTESFATVVGVVNA